MREELQQAMPVDVITLLLALLAVAGQVLVLVLVVAWAGSRIGIGVLQRMHRGLIAAIAPEALVLAAGVALVAMLGSLYLSEVADFPPCRLCWYQRIAMYPLVLLLGAAIVRRVPARHVRAMLLPVTMTGAAISVYHYQLERFPEQEHLVACDLANPCTITWVWRFHYISIPLLALTAFVLITTLLLATRVLDQRDTDIHDRKDDGHG